MVLVKGAVSGPGQRGVRSHLLCNPESRDLLGAPAGVPTARGGETFTLLVQAGEGRGDESTKQGARAPPAKGAPDRVRWAGRALRSIRRAERRARIDCWWRRSRRGAAGQQLCSRAGPAVGNRRPRARLLEACSRATRGSMDGARAALSKRRAGHPGTLGSRPRRAAPGSGCARGTRHVAGRVGRTGRWGEEGAGARPGRGTRRGSRRPGCEQLQNEASSLPGILAATPWKGALCQGGTGASALPRVQVGGPGPRRGGGGEGLSPDRGRIPSPPPAPGDDRCWACLQSQALPEHLQCGCPCCRRRG